MKALTLTQPWATLVSIGAKRVETRSWNTHYRGPLAIHAAKSMPEEAERFANNVAYMPLTGAGYESSDQLPKGVVLAVVQLVDVMRIDRVLVAEKGFTMVDNDKGPMALSDTEFIFGDFTPGRYAWLISDEGRYVIDNEPVRGRLNLWDWEPAKPFEEWQLAGTTVRH